MTDHESPNEETLTATDEELAAAADELAELEAAEPPEALPATTELPTEIETKTVYRGSGVRWGFVVGLILAVLLVILVFQNTDPVAFRFLVWEIETPLAALLIATAVIAAVTDELVGLVVRNQRRKRLSEKEELEKLRQQNQT